MKFCVYCGAQLEPNDKFCTACGKNVLISQESTGQQDLNSDASEKPQKYTPPIPPGQSAGAVPRQYTPPSQPERVSPQVGPQHDTQPIQHGQNIPPVQPEQYASPRQSAQYAGPRQSEQYANPNTAPQPYSSPGQHSGPPHYQPVTPSSRSFASPGAPQPRPGGSNPFTQFSEEMNTGNIQKRTGGRGMLLGGIIILIVAAIVIGGLIIALRLKNKSQENDDTPKDKISASIDEEPENDENSEKSDNEKSAKVLPENVKTDAILSDIAGYWEGTILFTRMEGFENIPPEDLPPDMDMEATIAEIMASPAPMRMEIEEDGNWELEIDIVMGMLLGSRDYERDEYEISPLLIKNLDKGVFNVDFSEQIDEDGVSGESQLSLSGTVIQDGGTLSIEGTFLISVTQDDIVITEEGNYTIFPQQNED